MIILCACLKQQKHAKTTKILAVGIAIKHQATPRQTPTTPSTDMREALTKQLLDPADVAPKTKTLEETIWDQMTSLLPKETLAKNLFSDKALFEKYTALIKESVTKNFREEEALLEAMSTKAFSFSFEVAIDAYPQELGGNNEKRTGEQTGVLTFHFEGIPDGTIPLPPKEEPEDSASNRKVVMVMVMLLVLVLLRLRLFWCWLFSCWCWCWFVAGACVCVCVVPWCAHARCVC